MLVIRCNKLLSDKQFNKYVEMFNAQIKKNGFLILPAEFNVVTNREVYICDPAKNASCEKGGILPDGVLLHNESCVCRGG